MKGRAIRDVVIVSGVRLIITMIHELKRRNQRFGCAALCASGGPAHAFIVEVMD